MLKSITIAVFLVEVWPLFLGRGGANFHGKYNGASPSFDIAVNSVV